MISHRMLTSFVLAFAVPLAATTENLRAEGPWEMTAESEAALHKGIRWLTANQSAEGNWGSNDLGLVSMGALAYLAAGHLPGRGEHGRACERALNYVVQNAKPTGLLNIADEHRDMYNHGLSTFVLGQAYGMTGDNRLGPAFDRALKLIAETQCDDGGWDYLAKPQKRGHDLSLVVMQAKALRSAVDSGFEVPPEVIQLAITDVRRHYLPQHGKRGSEEIERQGPGQFTYDGGGRATVAMAAAGVVCLQEFGQYEDWRIGKSMDVIEAAVAEATKEKPRRNGNVPFDAYALYYVGQALYQTGGDYWDKSYPKLRDHLVGVQVLEPQNPQRDGVWQSGGHVGGRPGELYGTAVACFVLAMPNRYLPILQEGKIERFVKEQ
ncbi:MAG: squalene--hopene cyclase [Planctomycetales bacterium]|nr:squalene--hopene cyclase [Planctomycetales bacterium]